MPEIGGGQFAQVTGGREALAAAIKRRGGDPTSVLNQVSASASSGPSQVAPAIPEVNPQIGNVPSANIPQVPTPEAPAPQTFRSAEAEIALKALADVVKTENKIATSALQIQGLV